jgi:hypothetical protein
VPHCRTQRVIQSILRITVTADYGDGLPDYGDSLRDLASHRGDVLYRVNCHRNPDVLYQVNCHRNPAEIASVDYLVQVTTRGFCVLRLSWIFRKVEPAGQTRDVLGFAWCAQSFSTAASADSERDLVGLRCWITVVGLR